MATRIAPPRTGRIGDCYEYTRLGRKLAGVDRMTIDQLVAHSKAWPETWHCYDQDGLVVWAHRGAEVALRDLPYALRPIRQ